MEKQKFNKKSFKKLATMNFDSKEEPKEKTFQRLSLKSKRHQSNYNNINYKTSNKLKELLEQKEESEEEEEEDIKKIPFELSNLNDMYDLLDNFSDKSDEKIELEFESTTPEEAIELMDKYFQESTKQIMDNVKLFDKEAVELSKEFYNNFINNLSINDLLKNSNIIENKNTIKDDTNSNYDNMNFNFESNKRKSYMESKGSNMISESITSEDNTPKIKNFFLGQSGTSQNYGKYFSLNNKNKTSSKFFMDEVDEENLDKIIEVTKKKQEK